MSRLYYVAVAEKSEDGYAAFFPDFPGCVTAGGSSADLAYQAEKALDLHIRGMLEDGEKPPAPTPIEDVERDPEIEEAFRILVPYASPGKSVRLSITLEESLLSKTDHAAKVRKVSGGRSGYIALALRRQLEDDGEIAASDR